MLRPPQVMPVPLPCRPVCLVRESWSWRVCARCATMRPAASWWVHPGWRHVTGGACLVARVETTAVYCGGIRPLSHVLLLNCCSRRYCRATLLPAWRTRWVAGMVTPTKVRMQRRLHSALNAQHASICVHHTHRARTPQQSALLSPDLPCPPAAGNLLPAEGLVTSSEDYYPTVAINALMRVLRDPGMASQHQAVRRTAPDGTHRPGGISGTAAPGGHVVDISAAQLCNRLHSPAATHSHHPQLVLPGGVCADEHLQGAGRGVRALPAQGAAGAVRGAARVRRRLPARVHPGPADRPHAGERLRFESGAGV